jgi:hypothetical protein
MSVRETDESDGILLVKQAEVFCDETMRIALVV